MKIAALRPGPRFCLRDQRRRLIRMFSAGRAGLADWASFQDLIDPGPRRAGKGELRASSAAAASYHLLGKWIENRAGVEMTAVPYRGSVPALHRRDRRPARRHDRYRDLGDPAHPQRPVAGARGVVAAALSAACRIRPAWVETVPGIQLIVVARAGGAAANASPDHRSGSTARSGRALDLPDVRSWLAETGVLAAPIHRLEELQQRVETEIELYSKILEVERPSRDRDNAKATQLIYQPASRRTT